MVFDLQDPDGRISQDTRDTIEKLCEALLEQVDTISNTTFDALQSLAAVTAFIISERCVDRDSAHHAIAVITTSIASSIQQAELDGNTNWSQKVKH